MVLEVTLATSLKPIRTTSNVVRVQLIGPAWWITYLVVPLISVVIALLAAWVAHRFTMREQRRQSSDEKLNAERHAQVDQNVKLDEFLAVLNSANAALDTVDSEGRPSASIPINSLLDLGTKCQLGGVLGDLIRTGVAYDSLWQRWQRWQRGSTSDVAELDALLRNLKEALAHVKNVAQSTLENGRARLNQLDLLTKGRR